MKMNKGYKTLMLVPLVIDSIMILFFLDDSIPAHFGVETVDRWGSKYELMILPILTIIFGLFGHWIQNKETPITGLNIPNNKQVLSIANILGLLILNVINVIIVYVSYHKIENLSDAHVSEIICLSIGLLLIGIGNYMPKAKRNPVIGIRTKWSMQNEITWKKSQQFGAVSLVISGVIIMIISIFCFFKQGNPMLALLPVTLITLIVCIGYTYYLAKKYPGRDIV